MNPSILASQDEHLIYVGAHSAIDAAGHIHAVDAAWPASDAELPSAVASWDAADGEATAPLRRMVTAAELRTAKSSGVFTMNKGIE